MMRGSVLIVLVVAGCAESGDGGPTGRLRGRILKVSDGDTIKVLFEGKARKVRLHGVDCPERDQPFGVKAKAFVSRYVGQPVQYEVVTRDRYGRTVARVFIESCSGRTAKCRDVDLNEELLKAGLAWWYKRYAPKRTDYGQLEATARSARRGLWAGLQSIAPWTWRRMSKSARAEARRLWRARSAVKVPKCRGDSDCTLPAAGSYHGNTRSKALHAPGCRHYNCKYCTAKFSTPTAARRKGYRAHSCVAGDRSRKPGAGG